jgi:ribosomal protein S17E
MMNNVRYMKKILLSFSLLFILNVANGQTLLEPISKVITRVKSPGNTKEIAYIGMRCGTLYALVAAYFENNGNPTDVPTIQEMRRQSEIFTRVGVSLDMTINKMSSEDIKKQGASLINYYAKMMSEGNKQNKNAVTPVIETDLDSCKAEAEGYGQISAKIK